VQQSHAFEKAKITVFDPAVCKTPDALLQNDLLYWTFVVRGDIWRDYNWPTEINQPTKSQSIVSTYLDGNTNSKFDTSPVT